MPKTDLVVALATAVLSLSAYCVSGLKAAEPDVRPVGGADAFGGYATTHVLVKLRPELARALRTSRRDQQSKAVTGWRGDGRGGQLAGDPLPAMSAALQDTLARWWATGIRPVFANEFRDPNAASRYALDRMFVIEVPRGTDTPRMAAALRAHRGEIEEAGVDAIGGVAACPDLPDDSSLSAQWGMHNVGQVITGTRGLADADIDAPEAWQLHTGEVGEVIIAVLDSGVYEHIEFADRMLPGRNTVAGADPNDTSDGCFTTGHGTHVTGIAAAGGNNNAGVAGVTWGANILPVKVLGPPLHVNPCNGSVSSLAAGIRWAADWPCFDKDPCLDPRRVDVINMSLQYYNLLEFSVTILQSAVDYAYGLGIVVVAATGNYGRPPIAYPAILENVVAVGATTKEDELAGFSNYGQQMDVSAPGDNIYSTYSGGNYGLLFGTSMATPHVSGVAALLKSMTPELTNDQIVDIILASTDDLGTKGWDQFFGHGRVNAHKALATALGGIVSSSPGSCLVDAGMPHDPSDETNRFGWRSVELTFAEEVSDLTPDDFEVSSDGAVAAPAVAAVEQVTLRTVRIELDAAIEVAAWTTISHKTSGTSIRLGFLPGDVNGDGVSNTSDIFHLTDALKGLGHLRPITSLDLDRSGAFTPADLLQIIDLFDGVGAFEPFYLATLP